LFIAETKGKLKKFFDESKDILGTFTAHEILQLRITMIQFVYKQNLLGHVTARNQNEIRAVQLAKEELVKVIHVLAESQPQIIQLSLEDQMSIR
jgi:hypothetical protein